MLLVLPALLQLAYVGVYSVDVPFWDDWDYIEDLQQVRQGEALAKVVWEPHNEHRPFVHALIAYGLNRLSHGSMPLHMVAGWSIAVLTMAGWWRLYDGLPGRLAALVPAAWLVFSLGQWENTLWAFQITQQLYGAGAVWAVVFLRSTSHAALALALAGAVVSASSLISGFAIWPAALPLLAAARRFTALAVWVAAGLAAGYLHFSTASLNPWGPNPSLGSIADAPLAALVYFLVTVGSPLAGGDPELGLAGGLCVLGAALALGAGHAHAREWPEPARLGLWTLFVFSVASSAMTTAGRFTAGPAAAVHGRYVMASTAAVVAVALLAAAAAQDEPGASRSARPLLYALWGVLALGLLKANVHGLGAGLEAWRQRSEGAYAIAWHAHMPDAAVQLVHPRAVRVRELIPFAEANGLSVFGRRDAPTSMELLGGLRLTAQGSPAVEVTGTRWRPRLFAHAPVESRLFVPPGARGFEVTIGFREDVFRRPELGAQADGATFSVRGRRADGTADVLFEKLLDPRLPRHAAPRPVAVDLEPGRYAELQLAIATGPGNLFDWTYWESPRFR